MASRQRVRKRMERNSPFHSGFLVTTLYPGLPQAGYETHVRLAIDTTHKIIQCTAVWGNVGNHIHVPIAMKNSSLFLFPQVRSIH